MVYLSYLLGQKVYFDRKLYGKMTDFAVLESSPNPSISKVVVKKNGKKITVSPSALSFKKNRTILISDKIPFLPFDEREFYLNEDLLDKQVIDIDDKRLVRVNDIALDDTKELKVVGIDIGASGIFRRLGLGSIIKTDPKIIPWQMIEAFDYRTGNIKLGLSQNRLNKMHPAELADILENLGARERAGMVESLEASRAAKAIEETDYRTQEAILEGIALPVLKKVVLKMHSYAIARLFYKITPLRIKEILKSIGQERAHKVETILDFGTDTAGGIMRTTFWKFDGDLTVKEAYNRLFEKFPKPEAIIVTNGNERYVGTIYTKDILDSDSLSQLKDIVSERKFVYPNVNINHLVELFARYNLRTLPVVDKDKKPIGVVRIDIVLEKIAEGLRKDELI